MKAIALYDFSGSSDGEEISFRAGDVIVVTCTESSDGWWEGCTSSGQLGVFPQLYVELLPDSPTSTTFELANSPLPTRAFPDPSAMHLPPPDLPPSLGDIGTLRERNQSNDLQQSDDGGSESDSCTGNGPEDSNQSGVLPRMSTNKGKSLRRSLNRFSHFAQSGAEEFILRSDPSLDIHTLDDNVVIDGRNGPHWAKSGDKQQAADSISITGYTTQSKYAGTKHFTAYQITNSKTNSFVLRRYKHFVWFHGILLKKFTTLCLPALPEKQSTANARRQHELESYLRRLSRHPVVGESEVFAFFTSCGSSADWKAGKRAAERDPIKAEKFLQTIRVKNASLSEDGDSPQVEKFKRFAQTMATRLPILITAAKTFDNIAPMLQTFNLRLSMAFQQLLAKDPVQIQDHAKMPVAGSSCWCWREECLACSELSNSLHATSAAFRDTAFFWKICSQKSFSPLLRQLEEYTQLVSSMQVAVNLHDKTAERLREARKIGDGDAVEMIASRCDLLFNVAFAEFDRFHDERVDDFSALLKDFLDAQIRFHSNLKERIEHARSTLN